MIIVTVSVRLKKEVLDTAGRALAARLVDLGYGEIKQAKVGKLIELNIDSADELSAKERAEQMCHALLVNSDIEDFEIVSVVNET